MPMLETIPVELEIVLGTAEVPIRQVLKMSRGAIIPLGCGHDDPTLVLVNGKLVARGRVLVADDRMSIEIAAVVGKDL